MITIISFVGVWLGGVGIGVWFGLVRGAKYGAVLERRAEAHRRLTARTQTEWAFRETQVGHDPTWMLYARSPEGHEYTRRVEEGPRGKKDMGTWFEVETATKADSATQTEITHRFNAWQILVATGAREKEPKNE